LELEGTCQRVTERETNCAPTTAVTDLMVHNPWLVLVGHCVGAHALAGGGLLCWSAQQTH